MCMYMYIHVCNFSPFFPGQGHDRHLFGLFHLVKRQGGEIPQIFMDPSYAGSCQFRLSTSTLGSIAYLHQGTFGPVVPNGYGISKLLTTLCLLLFGAIGSCQFFSTSVSFRSTLNHALIRSKPNGKLFPGPWVFISGLY